MVTNSNGINSVLSTSPIAPETASLVPVDAPVTGGHVLTVGPGEEFSDLWDAIANAQNNDVIAVDAGTYVDDSNSRQNGYVNAANVTIEGVGGMFHIVEPSGGQPYNQKAPIVAENGLTVKNIEVSGVTAHNLNGAGLRVDSGDLTVENSYFHDNQDGILGGANNDTITIDHSEFANNGQGGGGSAHNVYIGTVDGPTAGVLNFTNNLSISADTGHELKSRAIVNNISNNVIADLSGTSSYDIDITNGGATIIQNNLIEKGPNAENVTVISYGEENQFANPNSSLLVQNNTVLYDRGNPYAPVLVNNQSQNALGTAIPVTVINTSVYGLATNQILNGPGTVTNTTELASEPSIPITAPFANAPVIQPYTGTLTLQLNGAVPTAHGVSGGKTGAIITDNQGNVIDSGSVGIYLIENYHGSVTTRVGSVNTLTINSTSNILSQGSDTINLSGGNYTSVVASGKTTINVASSSWDKLTLNGQETVNAPGSASYVIGSAANVTLNNACGSFDLTKPAGATLALNQSNGTVNGVPFWFDPKRAGNIAASGGAVAFHWDGYNLYATATDSAPDSFVYAGGFAAITGGSGADTYMIGNTILPSGFLEIHGFKQGADKIILSGGISVLATSYTAGNTTLTLTNGTTIQVDGVSLKSTDFGLPPTSTTTTLELSGGTLDLAAGSQLDGAAFQGTIRDGIVTATGGSLGASSALTLDDVAWIGTLAAVGSSLTLLDGTTVRATSGGAGVLDAARLAGPLTITGVFDQASILLAGGTLQAGAGGLQLGAASTLSLGAGAAVLGGLSNPITDAGSIALSGGSATVSGLTSTGTISVTAGTLSAVGLVNTGTITLTGGGTLQLAGAAALGGTVAFGSTGANRLGFGGAGYASATLSGFRFGDTIDLGGLAYGSNLALSFQGSTLGVFNAGTQVASFTLQTAGGTASYGAGQFELSSDGAGGTLLSTQYRPTTPVWTGAGADFDAAYYLAQYPSVATSGMDPLTHYLTVGWKLGYNPNAWFNTNYYLNQNPDVAASGTNPLVHYETFGWKEGRDPSILFSTKGYLAANPDVAAASIDPLQSFLDYGQFQGRQPVPATPHLNTPQDSLVAGAWYDAQYPDAAASGLDPTQYYNQVGWKLGENPDPWFDTKYYLTANPDIAKAGVNPLQQFEVYGWKEGRQPSLAFNDQAYLAANPDVAAAGVDPLLHYVIFGQFEGRMTFINAPASTTTAPDPLMDRAYYFAQLASIVPASADAFASYDQQGWKLGLNPDAWFNTSYYLAQNPDVAKAGIDPLAHFEAFGWKEGRNPSANFSVAKYLAAYPQVAASGQDPLVQFITSGQAQGMQAFSV